MPQPTPRGRLTNAEAAVLIDVTAVTASVESSFSECLGNELQELPDLLQDDALRPRPEGAGAGAGALPLLYLSFVGCANGEADRTPHGPRCESGARCPPPPPGRCAGAQRGPQTERDGLERGLPAARRRALVHSATCWRRGAAAAHREAGGVREEERPDLSRARRAATHTCHRLPALRYVQHSRKVGAWGSSGVLERGAERRADARTARRAQLMMKERQAGNAEVRFRCSRHQRAPAC